MKNQPLYLLISLCLLLGLASCFKEKIRASGEVTVRDYPFTDFDRLDICCDLKAFVSFSPTNTSVQVEADDNLHEHLVVELSGNTLVVRLDDDIRVVGNETMNVYVSVPLLQAIEASGDAEVVLETPLSTKKLKLDLSGDSQLSGVLDVLSLDVELRGDSWMAVTGSTKTLKAEIKGDSKLENFDFIVEELDIELSGDSEAYLTVNEQIEVEASGDSKLVYKGEATIVRERLTGDSELVKVD